MTALFMMTFLWIRDNPLKNENSKKSRQMHLRKSGTTSYKRPYFIECVMFACWDAFAQFHLILKVVLHKLESIITT